MNVTPNDIAHYITQAAANAGHPVLLQHLQNLTFMVQGWTLALTGRPAFTQCFEVTQQGPSIQEIAIAYNHQAGLLAPPREQSGDRQIDPLWGIRVGQEQHQVALSPQLRSIIVAVLRTYGGNPFALHELITTSPLWAHSATTENKVDLANLKAYFEALPPLQLDPKPHPVVSTWPYIYQAVDEGELNRQDRAWAMAQQEEADQAGLDRTAPRPSRPGLLSKLLGTAGK